MPYVRCPHHLQGKAPVEDQNRSRQPALGPLGIRIESGLLTSPGGAWNRLSECG